MMAFAMVCMYRREDAIPNTKTETGISFRKHRSQLPSLMQRPGVEECTL